MKVLPNGNPITELNYGLLIPPPSNQPYSLAPLYIGGQSPGEMHYALYLPKGADSLEAGETEI